MSTHPSKNLDHKKKFILKIREYLQNTGSDTYIEIIENNVFFLKRGEKNFDDLLIRDAFLFLDDESYPHYLKSINFHKNGQYIDSAEQVRRCLEEFLKFKLKNDKNLANNINV